MGNTANGVARGARRRLVAVAVATVVSAVALVVPGRPAAAGTSGPDAAGWALQVSVTGQSLGGVACASSTVCFAVGAWNGASLIYRWNGTSWSVDDTNPAPAEGLSSVACASSSLCFAVGNGPIESWNGTTWSVATTPSPTPSWDLSGVACAGADQCVAVGGTTVVTWNGTSWAVSTDAYGATLQAVACPGLDDCLDVGYVSHTSSSIIEQWDGTSWTQMPSGTVSGESLNGIACTSTSDCYAVGDFLPYTVVATWDGNSWTSEVGPVDPSSNNENVLNGVACASSSECFTVGYDDQNTSFGYGAGEYPILASGGAGSAWTNDAGLDLGGQGQLSAVACADAGHCFAVGSAFTGSNSFSAVIVGYGTTGTTGATAPTQLQFTDFPYGSWAGTGPFPVSVALEDASGGVVTSATATVSLAIASGGAAGAKLSCSPEASEAAVAGVATFSCSIDLVGRGYVLEATSGSLSTTVTFDVVPPSGPAPTISPLESPAPPPIPKSPYPSVSYGSGGVIHNPRIVLLFIGSSWCGYGLDPSCQVGGPTGNANSPTGLEDSLLTLFSRLSGSPYANLLSTYYDSSGYINSGAFQLVGSYVYPQDLGSAYTTDGTWNSLVADEVVPRADQALGITNTPDTVYVAVFGPSQLRSLAIGGGCADNGLSAGVNLANVAVPPNFIPSQYSAVDTTGTACTMDGNPGLSLVDAVDGMASHEVAELVTSPTNQGWSVNASAAPKYAHKARQIADVCMDASSDWDVLGGPGVEALWDPLGAGGCATREYLSAPPTLTGEVPVASDNAITLSWKPGVSFGPPVWGYLVTLNQIGVGPVEAWPESPSVTSATVSGLSGGEGYTLSVADLVGGGVGPAATTDRLVPSGTQLLATGTSTMPGGLAQSSAGTASATAVGQGTVSVSGYPADPYSSQPVSGAGQAGPSYFDVHVSADSRFSQLTVTACGYQSLSWYNGTGWQLVSNQSVNADGCVVAVLTPSTTPSIAELTGTVFAGTTGPVITPSPVPTIGLPDLPISDVTGPEPVIGPPLGSFPVPGPATTGTPPAFSVTRLAGADRVATAIAISQAAFPASGSAGAVVLASAEDYPDALAAGPLAVAKRAPLLLTGPDTLDPATAAEIQRVLSPGGLVYLVGGPAVLGPALEQELAGLGFSVQRLAGADRYRTAVAVAEALGGPSTVFEVDGTDFADGLSATPAAAGLGAVVLLTDGGVQDPATAAYLSTHPGTHYAVGGPAAQADPAATPVVGADRYATAALVATRFFPSSTGAVFATGANFPDALAGGAYAGEQGQPVLLVPDQGPLPSSLVDWITADPKLADGTVLGGAAAVSEAVLTLIQTAA